MTPLIQPTPKQMLFALRYLQYLNATLAYREVYGAKNDNVAAVEGSKLLRNPKVAPLVQHAMDQRAKRLGVTADRVLTELGHMAYIDPAEMYDEHNALLPVRDMPEHIRRAVASVETTELWEYEDEAEIDDDSSKSKGKGERRKVLVGYTKKLRLWDKKGSLELHGKHLKLFTDKVEHSGEVSIRRADQIRAGRERTRVQRS